MVSPFIPNPLPPNGFALPVNDIHAGFTLFGFLPFGNSRNSISPRLVLYNTKLEVKVIQTDYYEYKAISEADYLPNRFLASSQVLLKLPKHGVTFYLYLSKAAAEKALLQFLHNRGISLSTAARQMAGI